MSASIFKPIHPISIDIPKLRSPFTERPRHNSGPLKARRTLFAPINHAETQKFLDRELAEHTHNNYKKWDFDFNMEMPVDPSGRSGRYEWKQVRPPRPNQLTFAPPKRPRTNEEEEFDNSELYLPSLDQIQIPLRVEEDQENRMDVVICKDNNNKKQMKITDFLQSRKRSADCAYTKKLSSIPCKIKREESSHCS